MDNFFSSYLEEENTIVIALTKIKRDGNLGTTCMQGGTALDCGQRLGSPLSASFFFLFLF